MTTDWTKFRADTQAEFSDKNIKELNKTLLCCKVLHFFCKRSTLFVLSFIFILLNAWYYHSKGLIYTPILAILLHYPMFRLWEYFFLKDRANMSQEIECTIEIIQEIKAEKVK